MSTGNAVPWAVVGVILLAATSAIGGIEAGKTEVNGAGLLAFQLGEGSDASQYGLSMEMNHYVSDYFAVGARFGLSGSSIRDTDMMVLALYPQLTTCAPASETFSPYFGVGVGFQYAKVTYEGWGGQQTNDETEPGLLVYLGAKAFLSADVAVSFETRYEALFEYMESGVIGEYVGFSYFF